MGSGKSERVSAEVKGHATHVGESRVVEWGARAGYVASGIVHLLIAWIAFSLALGKRSGEADQSGAFRALASHPAGKVLMVAMVVGLVLLAVWQITEAVRAPEWKQKAKPLGKFVAYLILAAPALSLLTSHQTNSGSQTQQTTRTVLSMPGGKLLVVAAGLLVLGVGVYHVYKGWKRKFLQDLVENPGRPAETLGMVGYIAKGVALVVAGGLLGWAGLTGDTGQARGLDGAFKAVLAVSFGRVLVVAMAVGFVCFAAYCGVRARFGRV
ncbi:DUF1206 domain-containing protein [Aestuariimicrobium sp. T2.26MG-19.2B]|uniref:DUF1206 domain-containing protein n=1 Tax=Aestuariimicrobium sp. T2.26MG-19.2B TaxID=3040679 RepID=UPI0024776C48|nr:DUF1206 domain-containing protein [Aestuariimicrobium sp. T2.26MG-19.2B]CAI9409424.1 hypothetical protein AESSP_02232 [Aestuariimicrobium sp. T2.26MG-19.2B]